MPDDMHRSRKSAAPHRRHAQPKPHHKAAPMLSGGRRHSVSAVDVRRRRKLALFILSTLLVIECSAAALTSPVFTIKEVQVIGVAALPPDEANAVIGTTAIAPGCNWFRATRARIVAQIRKMHWVRTFSFERLFPNRLRVRVVPREPVAIAQAGAFSAEVDADGVPIRAARNGGAKALPHVIVPATTPLDYGSPIQDNAVIAALTLLHKQAVGMPVRIAKIQVDQSDNLCLNMEDNTSIQLGQAEELDEKIAVVRRIYERQPDISRSLLAINVSCPTKPACKLRPAVPPRPDAASMQAVSTNR